MSHWTLNDYYAASELRKVRGKMKIKLDESIAKTLEKYVEDTNAHVESDDLKYTLESAANALLARILAQKYPIA